jgi:Uma2 family endonuclease
MTVTVVLDRPWQAVKSNPKEIEYPESDGKPVGETDFHISVIFYLRAALRYFFRQVSDVYTAANMLFYYEEGDTSKFKVPDVFVVRGVTKHDRRTYKLWEENAAPIVAFEITSRSTKWEDIGDKKGFYEALGVKEYYLFDPVGEYLKPRFQGYRLEKGGYRRRTRNKDGSIISEEMGVILKPDGPMLRLIDPTTNEVVPSMEEAVENAYAARLQVELEAERARVEAQRAQAEAERAQAAVERADTAEAEVARLRAENERLKRQAGLP